MGSERQLRQRLQQYTDSTLSGVAPFILAAHSGSRDPSSIVIALCTITEGYVSQVLDMLVDTSTVRNDNLGRALLSDARDNMHSTWTKRYDWLKRVYGIQLAGQRPTQDLDALVDLRNALIHGNGRLTRMQAQNLGKALRLEKELRDRLSVDTQGHRLLVTANTGMRAVEITRDFVAGFDEKVQDRLPSIGASMELRASV